MSGVAACYWCHSNNKNKQPMEILCLKSLIMVSENVSFEGAYALKLKKLHFSNEKMVYECGSH